MIIIKNVSKAAPAILELERLFAKVVVATYQDGRQLLLIPTRRGVKVTNFTDVAKSRTKIVHDQETKSWEYLGISYDAKKKELAFEREQE